MPLGQARCDVVPRRVRPRVAVEQDDWCAGAAVPDPQGRLADVHELELEPLEQASPYALERT